MWKHEALDFTRWLSHSENLALLGDEIGIEISLVEREASVGSFSVDILAEEANTGRKIIIENQLEKTDHDHLGKLITYASGYDAEIIIWIVKEVRDEHRQAVDWLNEHTDDKINFFIVRLELWRIDDSPCAVKFQVVSRPNDWTRSVRNIISDTRQKQLEFWTKFREYAQFKKTSLSLRKPQPQHWYDISYGVSGARIALSINTIAKSIGCEIYIPDSPELFSTYEQFRDQIENEIGESLEWMQLPSKKACRIKLSRPGDIDETGQWKEYFKWLLDHAQKFSTVFSKYASA